MSLKQLAYVYYECISLNVYFEIYTKKIFAMCRALVFNPGPGDPRLYTLCVSLLSDTHGAVHGSLSK